MVGLERLGSGLQDCATQHARVEHKFQALDSQDKSIRDRTQIQTATSGETELNVTSWSKCSHQSKYKSMNGSNEPLWSRNFSHMVSKITMMVTMVFSTVNSLSVNWDQEVVRCGLSMFKPQPIYGSIAECQTSMVQFT